LPCCACSFRWRFFAGAGCPAGDLEISHDFLDINALLGQEPIQGLAGFFQGRDIGFALPYLGNKGVYIGLSASISGITYGTIR
jgi:hypothetical protein